MKKIILTLALCLVSFSKILAGDGDAFVSLQMGFLFNNTLNVSLGYEKELSYDNAYEIFGDAGCSLKKENNAFGKQYYWSGGIAYKTSIVRWKNASLRLNIAPFAGAYKGDFFVGTEGSFEYNYTFVNGWKFVLKQKNDVSFLHGDTFRNGLNVGLKIPL